MDKAVRRFGVLALTLLGTVTAACGGPNGEKGPALTSTAGTTSTVAATNASARDSYVIGDNDEVEGHRKENDDSTIRGYGHEADPVDKSAIATLVKRYYARAAADSVAACSLMYSGLLNGSRLADEAEAHAPAPDAPPLRGESCAQITSRLFKENHQQLAVAAATLVIAGVRISGARGIALLGFKTTPERQMPLHREDGSWKIDSLFDREIP